MMGPVLVGDIGGTNCRFATWDGHTASAVEVWPTSEEPTLAGCIARYRSLTDITPAASCVAVAGPIRDGAATLTNSPWSGSSHDLPQPGRLINDLHAAARGVGRIGPDHRVHLGGPPPLPGDDIAVLGVGTGLGQALLVDDQVVATEGGHANFAPANTKQDALLRWLRAEQGRVTIESVVSGPGLGRILRFCALEFPLSPRALKALRHEPAGAVVFAMVAEEPACAAAQELFLACVGSAAGDLALGSLLRGGVVLCGGVLPRIVGAARSGLLRQAFEDKPPMSALLQAMPLSLITHPHLGLIGAGVEAERLLSA
ncbi:MAG: glucokinase [Myxococcota bacterium]|jgi:glucokinase